MAEVDAGTAAEVEETAERQFLVLPPSVSVDGESHDVTVTIRQLVVNRANGTLTGQNPNGVTLNAAQFARLVWHLTALHSRLSANERQYAFDDTDASKTDIAPIVAVHSPSAGFSASSTMRRKNRSSAARKTPDRVSADNIGHGENGLETPLIMPTLPNI